MALHFFFRGDPKLESAATSDPAHVIPGARGKHVEKIQVALIDLDSANITPDGVYGSATASAVHEFKKKRGILNYQGKIDDIVGRKTMTTLDNEMFKMELSRRKGGGLNLNFKIGDVLLFPPPHGSPGLISFWVLQHKRHPGFMPFITTCIIEKKISGRIK